MIIGIDPGVSGALALLSRDGVVIDTAPTPTFWLHVGRGKRQRIDEDALFATLQLWRQFGADVAVIEHVGGMPGQRGMFQFGDSAGLVRGMCVALGLRRIMPRPADWKRDMKLSKDKDASTAMVGRLMPESAMKWRRGVARDADFAEAILLAYWAIHTRQPGI